jgi:hypothetical protein
MRILLLVPLVLLSSIACGTAAAGRPATVPEPEIWMQQVGQIFFGSGNSAPVTVNVEITNFAAIPLTLREVQLTSPGMMEYAIQPISRRFAEEIPPGESRSVTIFATAFTNIARLSPREPLSLRAVVHFEADSIRFREHVNQRIVGTPN